MEYLKISPRQYQKEIFKTCVEKNCLVVLPTGLGKTLIALMLSVQRLEKFPSEKILFLAPTKPLAEQHLNYFKKNLPELFGDIQLFTGQVKADQRKKIWQSADIVFSTPQCIANDLKNNLYDLKGVSLLVEDEAHRCLKNYDYNYVAKKYKEQAGNQKILGLTASPGSEYSKIKEICRNLSIEEVEIRTRESEDVKDYVQELNFQKVSIDFPEEMEEIRNSLKKLFERQVEELRSRGVLFGFVTKKELINLQKKISLLILRNNSNYNYFHAASACAKAIKIQHALELIETQTLKSFSDYLNKLIEQAKTNKNSFKLISDPEFIYSNVKAKQLLEKNFEHPKIAKLLEIANEEILNNKDAKIIVFTQFRDTASIISKRLNEIKSVKSKIFIGQSKKTEKGLSQKDQKRIIDEFSEGKINILCATSIGEEGLDIPEVNSVIFYEPITSEIRSIQRAGRTARLIKGKLIILMTKKTRDENYYYVSRAKEKKMHSAISSIKEGFSNSEKNIKQGSIKDFL